MSSWRNLLHRRERYTRPRVAAPDADSSGASGELMHGRYAWRWFLIASVIGAIAGLGAIAFDLAINLVTTLVLENFAATSVPRTIGDRPNPFGSIEHIGGHKALLPVVLAAGGLVGGFLVAKLAPETGGGGNDSVIASYHYEAGQMRWRVPFVKLIASAITLGTGGSAGREGPAAQLSAGFGSIVGELLNLNTSERRRCVLIGMGAGIGAIFRAPLGGAILATEMLYREDIESDALIPALVASIAGYTVFSAYGSFEPLFGDQTDVLFDDPAQLAHFAVLGVLAGLVGLLFIRVYQKSELLFQRLPVGLPARAAGAGFAVGLIGLFAPQTLETGYGWVQRAIDGQFDEVALWLLLLLPFIKILATSLTIGSGTSGGLFGPAVFVGAMLGAGYWRLFDDWLPWMPEDPASMTIIAMIAYVGAVAHVPLAAMLMVAEMTHNLSLMAPAMIAIAIASAIVGSESLFRSQLPARSDSPVHRHRFAFPLLSTLIAGEASQRPVVVLRPGQTVEEAEDLLHLNGLTGAPVLGEDDELLGILSSRVIAQQPEDERANMRVEDLMVQPRTRFGRNATLDQVFDSMAAENLGWLPIVEPLGAGRLKLLGILTVGSVLAAYRRALQRNVRRADAMMVGSTLLEVRITPQSPLAGRPVRELDLPDDALLVTYTRGQVVRFPHGDTVFEPGDVVGVVTTAGAEARIRRLLEDEYLAEGV